MSRATIAPLIVFAPGSVIAASGDLAAGFISAHPGRSTPEFRFAMTGILTAELLAGASADVAIFANRAYADQVYGAGRLTLPVPLAGNRLALLVRNELTERITGLASISSPGVRVVAFPPDLDPCGAYTAELFAREGLAGTMVAKAQIGEFTIGKPGADLQERFRNGEADVAVIYTSFGTLFPDLCTVVLLPPEHDMHETILFTIGVVLDNRQSHPHAGDFVSWLLSDAGQAALRARGFLSRSTNEASGESA